MTPISSTALSELICTRISHDVIGNVGAVANAVELLEEGDMEFLDDIKSILTASSQVLSARLKFFRMAFGLDNSNLDRLDLVAETIKAYLETIGNRKYPIELDFHLQQNGAAKLVMLAVMVIADTMIRGGRISVGIEGGRLEVRSQPQVSPAEDKIQAITTALENSGFEPDARLAPLFYLQELVRQQNIKLSVVTSPNLGFLFA